ncbi:ankyrin repeat and protein kinase domain-containing protein 1-like [Glandiceps talaboti]
MNFLHKLGPYQLLHMDLKVANLLLNGFMEIKISDFGVSKIRTDSVVTTTKGAGTTTHIPPEHLKDPDRPVSEKFDVYSFAIVIWEITTRNKPYKGAFNIEHIKTSVAMFEARPNLDDVPVDAPQGLKELMVKCWDKDPVKRPHFSVILPQVKRIAESFDEDMLIVVSDVIRNLKLLT